MPRCCKRLLPLSFLVAMFTAAFAVYAAWQLNPQCSIHCPESGIDWGYLLSIGASWFVAAGLLVFVANYSLLCFLA